MAGYTKLFSSILASTIWQADMPTRIVWITLLAMADKNGVAEASVPGLADMAHVSLDECLRALRHLESPDEWSRSKEEGGRRIEPVDGGWLLINHAKYRAKMGADERREYLRVKQSEHRRKKASTLVNKHSESSTLSTHTEAEADTEATKIKNARRASRSEPEGFDVFWALYPRKVAKSAAMKAFRSLAPSADVLSAMLVAVASQAKSPEWTKDGGQFIPHPATWLRGRRWEDELPAPSRPKALGPDYAAVEDWEDECQRLHHGRCSSRYQHGLLV